MILLRLAALLYRGLSPADRCFILVLKPDLLMKRNGLTFFLEVKVLLN
jgi:hypothetical protein